MRRLIDFVTSEATVARVAKNQIEMDSGPEGLPWQPFMGAYVVVRPGKTLPTEAEVEAKRAEFDAHVAADKVFSDWQTAMAETDATMTRQSEDIIGTMTPTQFDKLPQYIQDAYAGKVTSRGEKP